MKKLKLSKKKWIILLVSLIVIMGLGIFVSQKLSKRSTDIEQGTVSYNSNFKTNAPGNIVFPAYTNDIRIQKNAKSLPITLVNPKVNKNVYFQYEFTITDSKTKKSTKIGKTKLIASGRALNELPLSVNNLKNLPRGTYECRIDVHAYVYEKKAKTSLNQAHWDIQVDLI